MNYMEDVSETSFNMCVYMYTQYTCVLSENCLLREVYLL